MMKKSRIFILGVLMASIFLPGFAIAAPGDIPEVGNISDIGNIAAPATTSDVTSGLGFLSGIGRFIMEYALHISIFFAVLAIVVLNGRGSWARSNQKTEEAAECRRNIKESIQDNGWTIVALMVVFFIFIPLVKSFIST
jgi:hypothetical protein